MSAENRAKKIAALLAELAALMAEEPVAPPEAPRRRPMPERTLLTVEEAAERLRIGRTRMFALVKSGEVESILIGRLRRVPVDAIDAYARRLAAEQSDAA